MAKKKVEEPTLPTVETPVETPVETSTSPVEKVSKMDAVRAALAEGIEDRTEIAAYILKRYGIEITIANVSAYKSSIQRKEGGEEPRQRKTPVNEEPTLSDLFRVKELVEAKDSLAAVTQQVRDVLELAEACGGLEKLSKCLEALSKLSG